MLPYVVVHNAVSLDGRITGFDVDLGLYYGLASHWNENATLVGSGTLIAAQDMPAEAPEESAALPAPNGDDPRPLLVAIDSRGRLRNWAWLRKQPYWRNVVVLCSRSTPPAYLDDLANQRIDYLVFGDDRVDLHAALESLNARYRVEVVRVDSGGALIGALLRARLVNEVSILLHPCLAGETKTVSFFQTPGPASPEDSVQLRLTHVEQMQAGVVWLRYEVK